MENEHTVKSVAWFAGKTIRISGYTLAVAVLVLVAVFKVML